MAYRYGNRHQMQLFPASIEGFVADDHPARAYDAILNEMNVEDMGISIDPNRVGNSQYNPLSMLKLLVYGYSYGIRSSRKLERACHENISFIWLVSGLKPDHKTISEFRRKNKKALSKVIKQCARVCIKLELIAGNVLFLDGTKIRANASMMNNYSRARVEKTLADLDERIEKLITECEQLDTQEDGAPSYVKIKKEINSAEKLKAKVTLALEELDKNPSKRKVNITDIDCSKMHSRQGSNLAYNGQAVVDEKNGLIVNCDIVTDKNDIGQLSEQMNQANKVLGKNCKISCADAGYSNTEKIKELDEQNINVIVPNQKQVSKKGLSDFDKTKFIYQSKTNTYRCPAGIELTLGRTDKKAGKYIYYGRQQCEKCDHFGQCTKNKKMGRSLTRYFDEEFRQQIARSYKTRVNQLIYKKRKQLCELPFGHIKHNLGASTFLLRGLDGVKAEMSLLSSSFNIIRSINILGVKRLVAALQ